LAQERPALDELELASAEENLRILREQEELFETLVGQGALPLVNLLDLRRVITETEQQVQAGEIYLEMSTEGQTHSRQIAQNAIAEARNALDVRLAELENYRIVAPADGIVESVLVQPGEYNQDTGRPAFVLASGLWFEAQVDQSALDLVSVGQVASVFLEARRGHPLNGVVERVVPVVTFNLGGPETNRPIRPKGTGAPEWPATFAVRVALPLEELPRLVPGLTGFARIESTSRGIGIPQAAVLSLSAGTGFVHVRDGDRFHTVGVRCGITSGRMTQVFGLDEGTDVLASGHTSLQADDQIKVVGNYVDPTWHAQP